MNEFEFGGTGGGTEEAMALGVILVVFLVVLVFSLAICVIFAYFMAAPLKRVPERYRTIEAWTPWLMLVPVVNLVMLWVLAPFKIPESLKNYFDDSGSSLDVGDCGKNLGLGWAISVTCTFIPIVNWISWIPALAFMILYLIKINGLKNEIPYDA